MAGTEGSPVGPQLRGGEAPSGGQYYGIMSSYGVYHGYYQAPKSSSRNAAC